jgi:hypothetical protein
VLFVTTILRAAAPAELTSFAQPPRRPRFGVSEIVFEFEIQIQSGSEE